VVVHATGATKSFRNSPASRPVPLIITTVITDDGKDRCEIVTQQVSTTASLLAFSKYHCYQGRGAPYQLPWIKGPWDVVTWVENSTGVESTSTEMTPSGSKKTSIEGMSGMMHLFGRIKTSPIVKIYHSLTETRKLLPCIIKH
jgi:hypothetical protein